MSTITFSTKNCKTEIISLSMLALLDECMLHIGTPKVSGMHHCKSLTSMSQKVNPLFFSINFPRKLHNNEAYKVFFFLTQIYNLNNK